MYIRKSRKLRNMTVREVSVVGKPANMRRFLIIKGAPMEKFIELLKKYCGDKGLDYEKIAKMDITAETIVELTKSIESLSEYQSDTPDEMIEAITGIVKQAVSISTPIEKDDSIEDLVEKLEKSGQKFSRATRDKLKSLRDEIDSLIPKEEEKDKEDEKPDIEKMLTEALEPVTKSITGITDGITKLSERLLTLEKGDSKSKQINKDKGVNEKKAFKEGDDPYETITKAWFASGTDENEGTNEEDSE